MIFTPPCSPGPALPRLLPLSPLCLFCSSFILSCSSSVHICPYCSFISSFSLPLHLHHSFLFLDCTPPVHLLFTLPQPCSFLYPTLIIHPLWLFLTYLPLSSFSDPLHPLICSIHTQGRLRSLKVSKTSLCLCVLGGGSGNSYLQPVIKDTGLFGPLANSHWDSNAAWLGYDSLAPGWDPPSIAMFCIHP